MPQAHRDRPPPPSGCSDEAAAIAAEAGLHYSLDDRPGIRRIRRGRGFAYVDAHGQPLTPGQRQRVHDLVIPPAWTDVWINPDPRGHLQATGRDARGRKQYRYHPRWRAVRDENKFDRLADFGRVLPGLRRQVEADLRRPGLPHEKVLALVVSLLDQTLIRIGSPQYAEQNESFGLTTLRPHHVDVDRSTIKFNFVGKSGLRRRLYLDDDRLARIVKRSSELGGQELFAYHNGDGELAPVESGAVNNYLATVTGQGITSKDFRTWGGTCAAGAALVIAREPADDREAELQVIAAIDVAAAVLGNTRAVCRNCYVHPSVVEAHRTGDLRDAWRRARGRDHFDRTEHMVLSILRSS